MLLIILIIAYYFMKKAHFFLHQRRLAPLRKHGVKVDHIRGARARLR